MRKKWLAVLVSLFLVMGMWPVAVWADNPGENALTATITEEDMDAGTASTPPIVSALERADIDLKSVTALKIVTEGDAFLSPADNEYLKANALSLSYLDESACQCSTRKLSDSYLTKSGLENREYAEFGGLSEFAALTTLIIPEGAEVINSYSVNQTGLTEISIPDSVLLIESGAFSSNIHAIGDIVVPDSVIMIGNNAFGAGDDTITCGALTLGNSVKYIDNSAFIKRTFQGDLVIPDSVEFIGNWVFTGPAFADGTWTLGSGLLSVGDASMSNICSGNSGTLVVPAQLETKDTCFGYNTFSKVVFEEGTTKIGARVVRDSQNLTEAVLPSTLVQLGTGAFLNCSSLSDVTLPDGLSSIGLDAFNSTGLPGIYIPESVTEIGVRAFEGLPEGSVVYVADNDVLALMRQLEDNQWSRRYEKSLTSLAVTNGLSFPEDMEFELGKLASPQKEGRIFVGWYTSDDFSGSPVETANPGTIYYAKWIGLKDVALQYDGTIQAEVSDEKELPLESLENWDSEDPSVATVDQSGMIHAAGVGSTVISAEGTYQGKDTVFECTVTVTPRVLSLSYQGSGSGSIHYSYSEGHQDVNDYISFQWQDEPRQTVTLEDGADLSYTYTVNDPQAPDSGEELTYSYLPMPVGEYRVQLNLLNRNYTIARSDSGTTDTISLSVKVASENSERVYLASANPVEDLSFSYDGEGKLPVEGVLSAYLQDDVGSAPVDIGFFTINIEGLNETSFSSEATSVKSGTDLSEIDGLTLPTQPGTYIITASAENESYYLYKSLVFTIDKAEVIITPRSYTVYVGGSMPAFEYDVSGLIGGDELTVEPVLSCEAGDTSTTGTYKIRAEGAEADEALYQLIYRTGTLRIRSRGSSSSSDEPSVGSPLPLAPGASYEPGEPTQPGAVSGSFKSDTTSSLTVDGTYQFRITSLDGTIPFLTVDNANFRVEFASQEGNDYFFKIHAQGAAGSTAVVSVNGVSLLTATVGGSAAGVISDTTAPFTVAQGGTYQFRLTASARPSFAAGSASFTVEYAGQSGSDYFYKVHAVGNVGDGCGFYINGEAAPVAVAAIA